MYIVKHSWCAIYCIICILLCSWEMMGLQMAPRIYSREEACHPFITRPLLGRTLPIWSIKPANHCLFLTFKWVRQLPALPAATSRARSRTPPALLGHLEAQSVPVNFPSTSPLHQPQASTSFNLNHNTSTNPSTSTSTTTANRSSEAAAATLPPAHSPKYSNLAVPTSPPP